jgi:hypothetical protein
MQAVFWGKCFVQDSAAVQENYACAVGVLGSLT